MSTNQVVGEEARCLSWQGEMLDVTVTSREGLERTRELGGGRRHGGDVEAALHAVTQAAQGGGHQPEARHHQPRQHRRGQRVHPGVVVQPEQGAETGAAQLGNAFNAPAGAVLGLATEQMRLRI